MNLLHKILSFLVDDLLILVTMHVYTWYYKIVDINNNYGNNYDTFDNIVNYFNFS